MMKERERHGNSPPHEHDFNVPHLQLQPAPPLTFVYTVFPTWLKVTQNVFLFFEMEKEVQLFLKCDRPDPPRDRIRHGRVQNSDSTPSRPPESHQSRSRTALSSAGNHRL